MKFLFFLLRWHYNTKSVFVSLNMCLSVEAIFARDLVVTILFVHTSKSSGKSSLCKNKNSVLKWIEVAGFLLTVL